LLDRWGKNGLLLLFLVVVPAAIYLQGVWQSEPEAQQSDHDNVNNRSLAWLAAPGIRALVLLIFLRAWVQMSVNSFLPKHLSDLGFGPGVFGPITALFMGGAAVGGVAGGWLADRYGNRIVASWSLALAIGPLAGLAFAHEPLVFSVYTFLAGTLVGASHSIIVVIAQRMFPGQIGAASGLVLGFTFASGAVGNLLSGIIADWIDIPRLFLLLAFLSGAAAILALTLKRKADPQLVQTQEPLSTIR
jgi:FSR family fosmidomycin resistance protein-like MFS transporter